MAVTAIKDHASQKRRNAIMRFFIYFFLIVITAFKIGRASCRERV